MKSCFKNHSHLSLCLLILIFITFNFLLTSTTFATRCVDVTHLGTNGFGFGNSTNEIKRFQTFTLKETTDILRIELKLRKISGSAQSDVIVDLYSVSNNRPVGSPLATSTIYSYYISSNWGRHSTFLRCSGLTPNQKYAIVLSQRTPKSDRYEWAVADVDSSLNFGKWNGAFWIDESDLGDAWMRITTRAPENIIDVTHNGTSGNGFGNYFNEIKRFQTFIVTDSASSLSGVDLKLRKFSGTAQSDVTVELYNTYNDLPIGLPLASSSIPASLIGTSWTTVHAPLKYSYLQQDKKYAIVLSQHSPRWERYEWAVGHCKNNLEFGKFNGTDWINESGLGDGWMKVWLGSYTSIIDVSHSRALGNGFGDITNELKRYQTFSINMTSNYNSMSKISGIDLKLRKYNGTNQSDVVVELYATNNNVPTGSPLATATIPAFSIGSDWTIVHAPLMFNSLQANTNYAILLSQKTPQSARYEWAVGHVDNRLEFGKYNGYSWINESGLGDGWMKVWYYSSDRITDISHSRLMGNGFGDYTNEIKRYQTFMAPSWHNQQVLTHIELKLRKFTGASQNDVTVEIYQTSNNVPTGLPIARAIIPSSSVGFDWTIVNVPIVCSLGPNIKYAVVLSQRNPQTSRYEWAVGEVDSNLDFGKYNGWQWINESGLGDGWMKVWCFPVNIN